MLIRHNEAGWFEIIGINKGFYPAGQMKKLRGGAVKDGLVPLRGGKRVCWYQVFHKRLLWVKRGFTAKAQS